MQPAVCGLTKHKTKITDHQNTNQMCRKSFWGILNWAEESGTPVTDSQLHCWSSEMTWWSRSLSWARTRQSLPYSFLNIYFNHYSTVLTTRMTCSSIRKQLSMVYLRVSLILTIKGLCLNIINHPLFLIIIHHILPYSGKKFPLNPRPPCPAHTIWFTLGQSM